MEAWVNLLTVYVTVKGIGYDESIPVAVHLTRRAAKADAEARASGPLEWRRPFKDDSDYANDGPFDWYAVHPVPLSLL